MLRLGGSNESIQVSTSSITGIQPCSPQDGGKNLAAASCLTASHKKGIECILFALNEEYIPLPQEGLWMPLSSQEIEIEMGFSIAVPQNRQLC